MEKGINSDKKKDFLPIVLYIGVQIFISIVISVVFSIKYGGDFIKNDRIYGIYNANSLLFYSIILVVIFGAMYWKKLGEWIKKFDKKKLLKLGMYALGFLIINFLLSTLIASLNIKMSNQDALNNAFDSTAILTFFPVAFFIPFVEEMVFRYSLSTIIKNKTVFIIVSSLIFAVMHGIGLVTILYFVLGLMLSLIYLKYDKNVLASTFVHMFNNTISAIMSII